MLYIISNNIGRQRLVNAEWPPIRRVLGNLILFGIKGAPQLHEKVETIHRHNTKLNIWRRGSDLNRRMEVLQTSVNSYNTAYILAISMFYAHLMPNCGILWA